MKKSDWRLTSEVVAIIVPKNSIVYLAAPEKKSYKAEVIKQLDPDEVYIETRLEENSFKLKLDNKLNVCISSESFSDPTKYYVVGNFCKDKSELGTILTQVKNNKGNFEDIEFEAIFSESDKNSVSFITNYMSEYKKCFEEMRRRLNCEICKKTKKFIKGHRYDTIESTIYYLGEAKIRKVKDNNSEFISDPEKATTIYLYTEEIKDGITTVSDIFKNYAFGSEIKYTYTISSMVDCGEVLKDDGEDFQNYWDILIENTENKEKYIDSYGKEVYEKPVNVFNIISIQSSECNDKINISDSSKAIIKSIIRKSAKQSILTTWGWGKNSINLNKNQTLEENIKSLERLTPTEFNDINIVRSLYYSDLFSYYDIDYQNIVKEVMMNWDEQTEIFSNFDSYLKNLDYVKSHCNTAIRNSIQRVSSTNYRLDVIKVKDLYGEDTELTNIIKEIFKSAKNNYGIGVRWFEYFNVGTKKNQKLFIRTEISLKDIIKYCNSNLTDSLKASIIKNKFVSVNIDIDFDKEIE